MLRLLLLGAGLTGEGAGMVGTHDWFVDDCGYFRFDRLPEKNSAELKR